MRYIQLLLLLFPLLAQAQQELADIKQFPPNMYLDTAYAPFYLGVASGDPLRDRVLIWTHVTPPDNTTQQITLQWQVALDTSFQQMVNNGSVNVTAATDWTVKVDADKLQPGGTYYYRFETPEGKYSQTGRAKTLPGDTVSHLRFAIGSCSSVFSGYFNAYARIAERDDINVMLHLGDYIYDYVDEQEPYRVSDPYPAEPRDLNAFRERHKYYLADPDLRKARQQQTWIVIWDNHDILSDNTPGNASGKQAFFEYVPIRAYYPQEPYRIYRDFHFGKLVDLYMLDEDSYDQKYPDPTKNTFLGIPQDRWLDFQLTASPAKWRIIGSQRLMGSWMRKGLPVKMFHIPGEGRYFDPGCWDGYVTERNHIYQLLRDNHIHNNIVVSGDLHMSFASNLVEDPLNRKLYNRHTGEGAVGVEFLPTSISRGNFDKQHLPKVVTNIARRVFRRINPQNVYMDLLQHGYGILDITPERCVAEFWYTPIRSVTTEQHMARGLQVLDGKDHWEWQQLLEPVK